MANNSVFTKQLSAASSNNISTSQSGSAGTPLLLNGAAASRLSTTSSSKADVGATVIPVSSVTGVVVGNTISDSTTSTAFVSGTKVTAVGTASVTVWPLVAGVLGVGSGDTIVFSGTAIIDTATASNSAIGRRVIFAYTGTDTTFTIVGTNSTGNIVTDVVTGVTGAGQSNLDFVTVISVTPTGGGLTGVTVGTNGVGSSPWWTINYYSDNDVNVGFDVEVVSGSVNYTIQHTYDEPNNLQGGALFPEAFNHPVVQSQTVSLDGVYAVPIGAVRVIINSGTGVLRVRYLQSGIG